MKTSIKLLLLAATSVVTACTVGQPAPPCAVGHGGYSAKFTRTAGSTSGVCVRPGDIIGVQKYRQTDGTSDIWLKSAWLAEEEWINVYAPGDAADGLSTGKLAGTNPVDNFCTAATMTPVTDVDPNGDTLTYTWSNVRFYVSGTVPGTQFTANLTISDGAGCSTDYTVDALYPVVICSDDTTGAPSQAACDEGIDHHWSHLAANPTFDMTCQNLRVAGDTDNGAFITGEALGTLPACVPAQPVPSVVAGTSL